MENKCSGEKCPHRAKYIVTLKNADEKSTSETDIWCHCCVLSAIDLLVLFRDLGGVVSVAPLATMN